MIAGGLGFALPVFAQTALDRVDPAQTERRIDRGEKPDDAPTVAVPQSDTDVPASDLKVQVGGVRLVGLQSLRQSDFADIVADYLGRTLTGAELGEMTERIAQRARERGYVFASAWIEPQRMTAGLIDVRIDEGAIDDVRLNGIDNRAVRAALAPLATGRPASMAEIERRLLIAGDIDGIRLQNSRLVREGDRRILIVDVTWDRFSGWVSVDNDSTRPIGPVEAIATINLNGLLANDDTLRLTAYNTIFEPEELVFGRVRYAKRITAGGAELSLTGAYSRSNPGSYLESLDIDGQSWFFGAGLLQPLLRRRASSLWVNAGFDVRDVRQHRSDEFVRHDRLAVARLGLAANARALAGRVRANLAVSQGVDALGATDRGDALASRDDADGTFSSLVGFVDWTGPLLGNITLNVAALGQLASQPLLISEEIGLGGGRFLRGYDYSERSGDQGAMVSGELRYDWDGIFSKDRGAELFVFADGGHVANLSDGFGSGSLFSTGGGVRADILRRLNAAVELAVPLSGARYDTGDSKPRVRFTVSSVF